LSGAPLEFFKVDWKLTSSSSVTQVEIRGPRPNLAGDGVSGEARKRKKCVEKCKEPINLVAGDGVSGEARKGKRCQKT
jgi:hypothetical protein